MKDDPFPEVRARYRITWHAGNLAARSGSAATAVDWLLKQKQVARITKAIPTERDVVLKIVLSIENAIESATRSDSWQRGNGSHINVEMGDVPEFVLVQTPYPKNVFCRLKISEVLSKGNVAIGEEFWALLNDAFDQSEYDMLDLNYSHFGNYLSGAEWYEIGDDSEDLFCYQAGVISIAGGLYISRNDTKPLMFTTTESGEVIGNCLMNDSLKYSWSRSGL
jgi:hypothetical protein